MIHPPDVIGKYAPDAVIGVIGEAAAGGGKGGGGGGGPKVFTVAEVAKHTTKGDCWVILNDRVLDVTNFLSSHPGGELAILTFAGRDATEEFNMIHPPDVVGKYAPDAIIGRVGSEAESKAASAVVPDVTKGSVASKKGEKSYEKMEMNKKARMAAYGKVPGLCGAIIYMAIGFMKELLCTIFTQSNIQFTSDRSGLTRSAMWLFLFIIIHAIGNLHVFLGPNDFNGYGYFYVRLYPTGFGLPANIVEIYVALGALLHICVALKRTWETKLGATPKSGGLNLIVSGICLLTFMSIHLFQFRFGETRGFFLCPPPFFINIAGILDMDHFLSLFWVHGDTCKSLADTVEVRDIYRLEFELFESLGWSLFYASAVIIFATHMCLGWKKCIPSPQLDIPKRYHNKAMHVGYIMTAFVCLLYLSFPFYAHVFALNNGCSPTNSFQYDNTDKFPWDNC